MLIDTNNSNVDGIITYPAGSENEYFTPAGMDYDTNTFDYGSWKDTFIMNLTKPVIYRNCLVTKEDEYTKIEFRENADFTTFQNLLTA